MWYQLFCGCGATSISDGIIVDRKFIERLNVIGRCALGCVRRNEKKNSCEIQGFKIIQIVQINHWSGDISLLMLFLRF